MKSTPAIPPVLRFTPPCLAMAVAVPPSGEEWVHEIKFDGYRVQALLESGSARILTRTGLDWTPRFGRLAGRLASLPVASAAIDAEAVVLDANGVSSFTLLQAELKKGVDAQIGLMAFDLLHLDGRDLAPLPLLERKASLSKLITCPTQRIEALRYVDHLRGDGREIFDNACTMGLEGIISKRADRPYRSGRHGDWTKAKCARADPFVVVGYTLQKGTQDLIGALALGYFHRNRLVYAGRVGTGFSLEEARALADGLPAIRTGPPPFAMHLDRAARNGVVWIEPTLVAQVAWRDVTGDGILRHASFLHLRSDKPAIEVRRPAAFGRIHRA